MRRIRVGMRGIIFRDDLTPAHHHEGVRMGKVEEDAGARGACKAGLHRRIEKGVAASGTSAAGTSAAITAVGTRSRTFWKVQRL